MAIQFVGHRRDLRRHRKQLPPCSRDCCGSIVGSGDLPIDCCGGVGVVSEVGGHVPWGAKAEFAYRAGYDGHGRLSVTHVVERGYSAMLKQPEMAAA